MVITGKKRWVVLIMVSILAGVMVYVPFLRYSYYDQMVLLFSEYKQVASASNVNEFIGDFSFWFGLICTIGYPIGGISFHDNRYLKKRLPEPPFLRYDDRGIWLMP